jgi:DNA repair protein RadC
MAEAASGSYHLTLREWPTSERPRERLIEHGADHLSNAELVAIILRTGVAGKTVIALAEELLASFGGLPGLRRASVRQLVRPGLGLAKAAQLKAALELGHRLSVETNRVSAISGADDVAAMLMDEMAELEQEQLRVVLLDTKNKVLGVRILYTGGLRTSLVRVAEVFRDAIRDSASGIILAHNHPSGDPTPSPEDVRMTLEVSQMGAQLDIDVVDHIIIGRGQWLSMRSRGLGFKRG